MSFVEGSKENVELCDELMNDDERPESLQLIVKESWKHILESCARNMESDITSVWHTKTNRKTFTLTLLEFLTEPDKLFLKS